mmetsp:Transcript_24714/g.21948  ORF Transcript_24714/g.21948 Transcript_24714/m.21948 type:complete len:184 (-) Transcript_24714:46-597(-)
MENNQNLMSLKHNKQEKYSLSRQSNYQGYKSTEISKHKISNTIDLRLKEYQNPKMAVHRIRRLQSSSLKKVFNNARLKQLQMNTRNNVNQQQEPMLKVQNMHTGVISTQAFNPSSKNLQPLTTYSGLNETPSYFTSKHSQLLPDEIQKPRANQSIRRLVGVKVKDLYQNIRSRKVRFKTNKLP